MRWAQGLGFMCSLCDSPNTALRIIAADAGGFGLRRCAHSVQCVFQYCDRVKTVRHSPP